MLTNAHCSPQHNASLPHSSRPAHHHACQFWLLNIKSIPLLHLHGRPPSADCHPLSRTTTPVSPWPRCLPSSLSPIPSACRRSRGVFQKQNIVGSCLWLLYPSVAPCHPQDQVPVFRVCSLTLRLAACLALVPLPSVSCLSLSLSTPSPPGCHSADLSAWSPLSIPILSLPDSLLLILQGPRDVTGWEEPDSQVRFPARHLHGTARVVPGQPSACDAVLSGPVCFPGAVRPAVGRCYCTPRRQPHHCCPLLSLASSVTLLLLTDNGHGRGQR